MRVLHKVIIPTHNRETSFRLSDRPGNQAHFGLYTNEVFAHTRANVVIRAATINAETCNYNRPLQLIGNSWRDVLERHERGQRDLRPEATDRVGNAHINSQAVQASGIGLTLTAVLLDCSASHPDSGQASVVLGGASLNDAPSVGQGLQGAVSTSSTCMPLRRPKNIAVSRPTAPMITQ